MAIQRMILAKQTPLFKWQSIRMISLTQRRDASHGDYQYLQRGQIPMLHFQRSLPRLPIPKLEQTCSRFLAAVRPILSNSAEYDELYNLVREFQMTGPGTELQRQLIARDRLNKHTNYVSEPWFDMYLSDRRPLPINYNPVLIWKPDERAAYNDQLTKTANLVVTTLRFMRSLREQLLEPEVFHLNPAKSDTKLYRHILRRTPTQIATYVSWAFKAFPLDMSQYEGLFGATRIPETGKDRIYRVTNTSHISVMRNGHIYAVKVLDGEGNILSPRAIINRLKFVLNHAASQKPAEYPLGVLTALNRDKWASIRQHLIDIHNEKSLEIIDSALFCVSLDSDEHDIANPVPIVQNTLHGNERGLYNRWFDKSFSLIVAKDGTSAINFEHSWGDGVAVLRLFNEVYKEITQSPFVQPSDISTAGNEDVSEDIIHVELNLDDKAKNDIKEAFASYRATVNSLDMNALIYPEMNKGFCKMHKVSPDAIMQLGFQLAYAKQTNGTYVGTYESCSTSAFKHGRTETVRPCTMDTKAFCDSILLNKSSKSPSVSPSEQRAMIVKCSETHGRLIKEAAMGQGFDRHLFGLKHLAQLQKQPLHEIYEHVGYRKINCNILSSSTLTSNGLHAGGFGPVERNGYGIGYNIQDGFLGTIVTNYAKERNGPEFVECLRESYDDIRKALEAKKD